MSRPNINHWVILSFRKLLNRASFKAKVNRLQLNMAALPWLAKRYLLHSKRRQQKKKE